jgi:urease accessory protein
VAVEKRFRTPLQALAPLTFADDPARGLVLLKPTGGVLGGDRLDTALHLDANSHVVVTTPSATRVYGGRAAAARLTTRAFVAHGATLEYVPDHLIPHPRARVEQSLHVELAAGARLLLWDAWTLGRPARGERWAFDRLVNTLRVEREGRPVFVDRVALTPAQRGLDALGGAEDHPYVGLWVATSDEARDWAALGRALADAAAAIPGLLVGASALARGGCVVRMLARSAPALLEAQRVLWASTRAQWLGLRAIDLRKP